MSLWGRWSTVSLFYVFLPVLTVKMLWFFLNKQITLCLCFSFFGGVQQKKKEHKQWLLNCRIHMHKRDFVTALWSISGRIYSREKRVLHCVLRQVRLQACWKMELGFKIILRNWTELTNFANRTEGIKGQLGRKRCSWRAFILWPILTT